MRAILSPADKRGLVSFARELLALGFELFASDGTARALSAEGIAVRNVSELTGHPEMLDGRVKTLHPAIYAGLLADRSRPAHLRQLTEHGYAPIDLVTCNLYPFAATIETPTATLDDAVENIDIGGVTLLRAAAKNFASVLPVVDPDDYEMVIDRLRARTDDLTWRRQLAAKTFRHIAAYDSHIAGYLEGPSEEFPAELTVALTKVQDLRYGENPHQRAALYAQTPNPQRAATLVGARQLHGKELSFNNLLDVGAAFSAVLDYSAIAVSVIKHGNPCGLACADDLARAYQKAHLGDPVAAFGGAVGLNRIVDRETAQLIAESHYDDLIAPGYAEDALAVLRKKKNLRIMQADADVLRPATLATNPLLTLDFRRIGGGFLVQSADQVAETAVQVRTATEREPTSEELRDLLFAWRAVKHVKSNAIVLASDRSLVGIGAGQMSRVDSVEIAVRKAGERATGSVLASDAYFPFPDGPEVAAKAGITAIIQPGGSIRDAEVIKVANQCGLAMVFTG
ncbi:MAG TPA: bifunctional phosphoribosylaminoimidazolecarboxamide formyltransferase/IMP cyclohydrolase, partial [Chloroflexota bacterium]|nr:bifunctional phosphoribosylaminoimidazolecarboxamide formyltransferase/IMP cyclohydrolase [Chloroflexota bacterium]